MTAGVDSAKITGERAMSSEAGFNPSWQRHVAYYKLIEPLLGPGRVLDLGCGVGHSFHLLAPRETIGVDVAAEALAGQDRETVVADMRDLPFEDASFASVISVQSLEHVPDPDRVLAEAARVLEPGPESVAVFATPNRLTFGRPDEIIDPYHYIEFDPRELEELCGRFFGTVQMHGFFASARYMVLYEQERRRLDRLLGLDPLRMRRLVPNRAKRVVYDLLLRRNRRDDDPRAAAIDPDDFSLQATDLDRALDLIAVCGDPLR